ncbi:MAG: Ig-like domain-containing protein [Acidobacteriota bacterium]
MFIRISAASVISLSIGALLIAGTPVINDSLSSPTSKQVRLMDPLRLSVWANDPSGHPLTYQWSIVQDPTNLVYFTADPGKTTTTVMGRGNIELGFPWISPTDDNLNQQYVGQTVQIVLTVQHANAADGTETATRTFVVTITGINHPPVPRITGQLGSPAARIVSGKGVICSAGESADPDQNDSFAADWAFGTTFGGSYTNGFPPQMFGGEGTSMSFTVPDMTSNIDQQILLQLSDGLHRVRTSAIAYLAPAGTTVTPPPPTTNQPPVATIKYKVGSGTLRTATSATVSINSPATITLDAGASSDDGGTDALSYSWTKIQGLAAGAATLTNSGTKTASLSIGSGTNGTVTLTLKVTDQAGLADTATVSFDIAALSLGPSVSVAVRSGSTVLTSAVEEGTVVTLDGSASTASDGTKSHLSYAWRQLEGPAVNLNGGNSSTATFVAPAVNLDGTLLKFELSVTDTQTGVAAQTQATVTVDLGATYFAQVGFGSLGNDQLRSVLLLVNNTAQAANDVKLEFFSSDGQPLEAVVDNQPWTNEPFTVPARFSTRLEFGGVGNTVQAGWARVKSATKLTGLELYQVIDPQTGEVKREMSVLSSTRGRSFTTYFNASEETALAVANPTDQPVQITVSLVDYVNGQESVVVTKPLFPEIPDGRLPARQHGAKFIGSNLFGTLPATFNEGALRVEADGEIIVTVIKTKEGVILSALPLAAAQ